MGEVFLPYARFHNEGSSEEAWSDQQGELTEQLSKVCEFMSSEVRTPPLCG